MRLTLLQMVQKILSALDDDEVNSISDTTSSEQVTDIVEDCYNELISELDLSGTDRLFKLEAVSDVDKPNYLKIPDDYKKMYWFRYRGKELRYKCPDDFIKYVLEQDGDTTVVDFGGGEYPIVTNEDPTYWTSFDDRYIVTDSINTTVESTLISGESLAWGNYLPDFRREDDFVPELPNQYFPLLLAKSKARAFVNLKQVANAEENASSRRGLVRSQNDRRRARQRKPYDGVPNYGRPRR